MNSVSEDIKNLLIQYAIKAVLEKLVSLTGFFALPIVNPLVTYVVTKLVTFLVNETALGLSLLWISLTVSYNVDSVESATKQLKLLLENPKGYTNEEAKNIESNFDDAAIKLIKLSVVKLH